MKIQKPELLYEHVAEVNERVVLIKDSNIDSFDADKIVVVLLYIIINYFEVNESASAIFSTAKT